MQVWIYVCTFMYLCMDVHVSMRVFMYIYMCMCLYICTYECVRVMDTSSLTLRFHYQMRLSLYTPSGDQRSKHSLQTPQ